MISTIISISTVEFNGRLFTPMAILVCFPASPKIWYKRSEAALMTCGCSEKFGVELTNPETRKILEILSNEPNCDFNCASAFIMHNLAAFCAFSIDCSSGTFQ